MSNHVPRIIPPNALVEITCVVLQNRYLLRPSDEVNDLVVGVLGEAQEKYEMTVCNVSVASTHYHLLIVPRDSQHMASFMGFVNANIAKEVGGLHDWSGKFWNDRYHHVVVSDEEAAQVSRLKYLLAHGVKEGLVDRVSQWPGINSAEPLIQGKSLIGHWYNRTQVYAARVLRGEKDVNPNDYAREVRLVLDPLPCWQDLSARELRSAVEGIVEEIEKEGALMRKEKDWCSLGVKKIKRMSPHHRPGVVKKSPKPKVHAIDRSAFERFREWWGGVLQAYREASERLAEGHRDASFPDGCFPPGLPYVPYPDLGSVARGQPV